jgi:hypothetical protein
MSETALAIVEDQPQSVMVRNQNVANACKAIVLKCSVHFAGRRYIQAEGWQALAALSGYTPRISTVEELESGDIRAICNLVRISDGELMASAEGFVGTDEPVWFGGQVTDKYGKTKTLPKRSKFAIRAMAQTRAISRACRSALAFLVPLVDSSLATTPAEEMPWEQEQSPEQEAPRSSGPAQPPTPSQRALLKRLTANLSESQLAELHEKFGPGDKLTKATASQVIEHLNNKASQPVNEDSEPVT